MCVSMDCLTSDNWYSLLRTEDRAFRIHVVVYKGCPREMMQLGPLKICNIGNENVPDTGDENVQESCLLIEYHELFVCLRAQHPTECRPTMHQLFASETNQEHATG